MRRLDGGIERQQIGFRGDLVDHRNDVADLASCLGQRVDGHT